MMDSQNGPSPPMGPMGGFLGGMRPGPSGAAQLSPYLNVDPSYLDAKPEFVFNSVSEEGKRKNPVAVLEHEFLSSPFFFK